MAYQRFEVVRKVQEGRGVVSLYLKPVDGTPVTQFYPGQHLLFKLNIPGREIPAFRCYSFSDAYHPEYYRVSVKKDGVGLCSSHIYDQVHVGDILNAKGPAGSFCIVPQEQKPLVLIAGGIGITPLLSMLKSIARDNPARDVFFFYGVNEQSDHCFLDELNALKEQRLNLKLFTFYGKVQPGDIKAVHYDYEGFITIEMLKQLLPGTVMDYYICGPGGMMDYITSGLELLGVDKEKIHTESFNMDFQLLETESLESNQDVFTVEFKKSGKKLNWDQRYKSILEFAEANDVEINSGCFFGDCGTCLVNIQQGEISYTHPTMVQPGKGKCLPCSCVPSTDLVLEA